MKDFEKIILGIDIGTTATKGILLDPSKGVIASEEVPSALISQKTGWAEEDPNEWWKNVAKVTQKCLNQIGASSKSIISIGVSGMVPTLILLDGKGSVLRPSIQQNDARAVKEIDDFKQRFDETEALNKTGSPISQQSIGPKLNWLRFNEKDKFNAMKKVCGSYDYIVYKLTSQHVCERNWALESGLFDVKKECWDKDILDYCGISEMNLGKVSWPATIVGEVSADAAKETGLCAGTAVVAGSADHIASAFSAGISKPGDMLVKLGGAGDILCCLDNLEVDERLFLDYHVIPGLYLINGCMATSGSIIKWFRENLAGDFDYEELETKGENIPAGSEGLVLLPYFLGEKTPINDPKARGMLMGLTLHHKQEHIYRAILEGISFGFLHHINVFKELNISPNSARLTNGGARSRLWKKITADVLEIPVEVVSNHPGSSLGAAFIAGKATGVFSSWEEIDRFIEIGETIDPDPEVSEIYKELFCIYREIYKRNKDVFEKLWEIST